jgi:hypothetical protein
MANATIKDHLNAHGWLTNILLPPAVDELLNALHPKELTVNPEVPGTAGLDPGKKLGFLALNLTPGVDVGYLLRIKPGDTPIQGDGTFGGFRLWVDLTAGGTRQEFFEFAEGTAGLVLTAAERDPAEERLTPKGGGVKILGLKAAILVDATAGEQATMRLSPTVGEEPGIIALTLDPPTVLIGSTEFGLEFPDPAFVIDDSTDAAAPGQTVLNGVVKVVSADTKEWRGLIARSVRLYIPSGVPILGGHAVEAYIEVGTEPGEGIHLAISTRIPASGSLPAIDVTIECQDPTATGLQDFVPTLVEASMELPLDGHQDSAGGGFELLAGKPVIARARFVRSAGDPDTHVTLAVESQGPDGVLTVKAPDGGGARILLAAAALATAIVADKAPPGADKGAVVLHELLVLAVGVSAFLEDQGRFTIHKVELSSSGHGVPAGEEVKLLIDYSVDVLVRPIDVGVLSVSMRPEQPMRVRNRNVGLTINPAESGVKMIQLDFRAADMEIEDPGGWKVQSPASLFDILGTRSGRGSSWVEVDLRFKLNMGPVKVTGATIRATLPEGDGKVVGSLRGLEASLEVPGAIEGTGSLQLLDDGGVTAALDIKIVPLDISTDGKILFRPKDGSFLLFVQLGLDLPSAIPIANTGLGIYGIGGSFAIHAAPAPPGPADAGDPIGYQLRWNPGNMSDPGSWVFRPDDMTFGAQAVVGTVPDLGFSFSSRAGLFLTVPDIVIRGALWGTILSPRMRVDDSPPADGPGISFLGAVVVDPNDGVTIGLQGTLAIPPILKVVVPLGARFPTGAESDNWFIYLGADGFPIEGRGLGPIRAEIFPDLQLGSADAYLMFRGRGIHKWPRGGAMDVNEGLVIAFGFGFEFTMGLPPVAWAEVHMQADILLATHPLTLAGFGTVGGSLHLGPFSVGVDATLSLLSVENAEPYVWARVCGHIDLWVHEISGCAEISINDKPSLDVPPPDIHPLDDVENGNVRGSRVFLVDDRYRRIGRLLEHVEELKTETDVWPDTLIHLSFGISPKLDPGFSDMIFPFFSIPQFPSIITYPAGLAAKPVGNDMLQYEWTLTRLALSDVTNDLHGSGSLVMGPLSAAWQAGKAGDLGTRPQPGDLVLLTYRDDLSLSALASAGKDSPNDPLTKAATACQSEVAPAAGWAVGFDAGFSGAAFLMPANPLSPDPCVSRFTATLTQYVSTMPGVPLTVSSATLMPPPYGLTPASLEVFDPELELDRPFEGALDLAVVTDRDSEPALFKRMPTMQAATLVPEVPLTMARLWLILDVPVPPDQQPPVTVFDDSGASWVVTNRKPVGGRTAFRFAPPAAVWANSIDIQWPAGSPLAVVGLGGITAAAIAAANARNAANQAEGKRKEEAAGKQPQQANDKTGDGVRAILDPGRTYRLEVAMTWGGQLYRQDENGNKQPAGTPKTGETTYKPKGAGGDAPTTRVFYFRTTPKPKPRQVEIVELPKYGAPEYTSTIHARQNLFKPEMLSRFLLGYTPAQTEMARFCDDPVQVHFSAAHLPALAKAYDYELRCGLQRVDVPGPAGDAVELVPQWISIQRPDLLSTVDQRRFEVAREAPCALPLPGGSLEVRGLELSAAAWYEVYTLAKYTGKDNLEDGRLEGVTFRTSRWHKPTEMLEGLVFTTIASWASGDIEVSKLPGAGESTIDGSDADYEAALDALGLEGWPATSDPRVSLIWLREDEGGWPSWKCAGLLLESPEPVDRPGRVEFEKGMPGIPAGLELVMTPRPTGVFDVRRSDQTRSRILWLCSAPFTPHSSLRRVLFGPPKPVPPVLTLHLKDSQSGDALHGSVRLPLTPSFANEEA